MRATSARLPQLYYTPLLDGSCGALEESIRATKPGVALIETNLRNFLDKEFDSPPHPTTKDQTLDVLATDVSDDSEIAGMNEFAHEEMHHEMRSGNREHRGCLQCRKGKPVVRYVNSNETRTTAVMMCLQYQTSFSHGHRHCVLCSFGDADSTARLPLWNRVGIPRPEYANLGRKG